MPAHVLETQLDRGPYRELNAHFDSDLGIAWCEMKPTGKPCFSTALLQEMLSLQDAISHQARTDYEAGTQNPLRYQVLASKWPGVFNLGGDLTLFQELILKKDRDCLLRYAKTCIDMVYRTATAYGLPLTTISLVQGEALGGGFEAALSSNIVIAERRARFGLPEVLFNLFPGMGAYPLLARRIGPVRAEELILSGKVYTAEELHKIGVIDILAEDGEGEQVVMRYIRKQERAPLSYRAMRQIRSSERPIDLAAMMDVIHLWVDTALQLPERDLRIMERLARSQNKLVAAPVTRPATAGDAVQPFPTFLEPSR
jgi:DSF synthase